MVCAPHHRRERLGAGLVGGDWPPTRGRPLLAPTTHWPLLTKPLTPCPSESEETRTVPTRAGDGPCDGGETRVGRFAPQIAVLHDSDGVPVALVFADEHGAWLEAPGAIRSPVCRPVRGHPHASPFGQSRPWPVRRRPGTKPGTKSLVKAGGGDERSRRHGGDASSSSDRTRAISTSITPRSNDG